MPAKSKAQQAMMAIAEHTPSKLYKKSRGVLKMSKKQLREFAQTPTKSLPRKKVDRGFYSHNKVPKPLKVIGGPTLK